MTTLARLLTISVVAALVLMGTAMGEISRTGLVGEWHFDGDAKDTSGSGNDGTIYGATFVDGKFGKAMSFDGVNDYIDLARATFAGKSAWTFSGWIYPSNEFGFYTEGHPELTLTIYAVSDGSIGVNSWNGNWLMSVSQPGAITISKWNYITITLENGDVGTGTIKFYVNGLLINSITGQMTNYSGTIYAAFGDNIGAYHGGTQPHYFFNGAIDEVRIYNRALNANEIKASYESSQIIITSSISGAEVLIDGISRGTASPAFTVSDIALGSHTVTCRLSGYSDSVNQVNLAASSTASVTCTLTVAPSSISVTSSPSGAEVYLDGTLKGPAPVMLKDVSPGNHIIWCKKSGYEDLQQSIDVTASGVATLTCALKPATTPSAIPLGMQSNTTALPTLSATPPVAVKSASITGKITDAKTGEPAKDVTINIEGKSATTDANGEYDLTVEVGKHSLSISKEGYETVTRSIIVPETGTMLDISIKSTSGDSSWLWIVIILIIVVVAAGIIYFLYRKKKLKEKEDKEKREKEEKEKQEREKKEEIERREKEKREKEIKEKEEKERKAKEKKSLCMFCHAPLIAGSKFCNECGKKQEEKTRFCMNCGSSMPHAPDLCSKCNKMPPSDVDTKTCKNCSEVIPAVAKFCGNCGARQPE